MILNVNNGINDIMTTTKPSLYNSCAGGLKINEIIGGMSQGENPSTDSPQDVNGSEISSIRVHKKNFLKVTQTMATARGLTIEYLNDGGVRLYGTHNSSAETGAFIMPLVLAEMPFSLPAGTYKISGCPEGGSATTYSFRQNRTQGAMDRGSGSAFTLKEKTTIRPSIVLASGTYGAEIDLTFYPMIRDASVEDDSFEIYQGKEISLSQPITLYNDVMSAKEIERKYKKVVYDGTETSWLREVTSTGFVRFYRRISNAMNISTRTKIFVSHFHFSETGSKDEYGVYVFSNGKIHFYMNLETVEEWQEWLSNNNVEVFYPLAESTTEELPTVDKIALNSLPTYDGVTYVEFDSEVTPTANVDYGKSKVGARALQACNEWCIAELKNKELNNTLAETTSDVNELVGQALYIVSFDSSTATLITKSADYEG